MLNMSNNGHQNKNGKNSQKPWKWMLIDSCIIGGIALFASLGGGAPTWDVAWIAFKAFGLSFFVQLAVERGLKRPPAN